MTYSYLYSKSQVVTHMMPDLPNTGRERDLAGMKEFFENPQFRADGMKIYPTLVIRGTGLYELWKTGHYKVFLLILSTFLNFCLNKVFYNVFRITPRMS